MGNLATPILMILVGASHTLESYLTTSKERDRFGFGSTDRSEWPNQRRARDKACLNLCTGAPLRRICRAHSRSP